jgi:hypothetical protein
MVGRAVRQRDANAPRPSGRAGSIPAPSATRAYLNGRAAAFQAEDASSILAVRSISPRSSSGRGCRSFKSGGAGSNPARGTNQPLRLAGRAPGFDLGGLGSTPRGAATSNRHRGIAQSVERRSHTPRQPQVRFLLPRPSFAGLAKWEGNGSWLRHEAVRSRQPVRACSSSVERRPPKPRQRAFNSFLARHHHYTREGWFSHAMPRFPDILAGSRSKSGHSCLAEFPDIAGTLVQLDCFAGVLSVLPRQADSHGEREGMRPGPRRSPNRRIDHKPAIRRTGLTQCSEPRIALRTCGVIKFALVVKTAPSRVGAAQCAG